MSDHLPERAVYDPDQDPDDFKDSDSLRNDGGTPNTGTHEIVVDAKSDEPWLLDTDEYDVDLVIEDASVGDSRKSIDSQQ